jgi:hypothetical protein
MRLFRSAMIGTVAIGAVTFGLSACSGQTPSQVPATVYVTAPAAQGNTQSSNYQPTPQTQPAVQTQPAAVTPGTATIPTNVKGMNAQALSDELDNLGFTNIIFNSSDGRTVLLPANWTVTGIDGAGATVPVGQTVVIHVHKPAN